MKIYRVENPNSGKGPYMCKYDVDISNVRNLEKMHDVHNNHNEIFPGFYRDFQVSTIVKLSSYRTNEVETLFGFTSIEKLEEWFNVYIKDLLESKLFVIKEYDVDESCVFVSDSEKQCVFVINRKLKSKAVVIDFTVTDEMQLNYEKIYQQALEDYFDW